MTALRRALEAVADPARAPGMAAYIKHRFHFLGVGSPARKQAQRPFLASLRRQGGGAVLDAAAALWSEPERELQYVGCDLLRRSTGRLDAGHLDDLWVARAALLHQLRLREHTDARRLFDSCERQASHPDFFICKAIGWALREYSKTDPEAVRAFVTAHTDRLSSLSRREASRLLP